MTDKLNHPAIIIDAFAKGTNEPFEFKFDPEKRKRMNELSKRAEEAQRLTQAETLKEEPKEIITNIKKHTRSSKHLKKIINVTLDATNSLNVVFTYTEEKPNKKYNFCNAFIPKYVKNENEEKKQGDFTIECTAKI